MSFRTVVALAAGLVAAAACDEDVGSDVDLVYLSRRGTESLIVAGQLDGDVFVPVDGLGTANRLAGFLDPRTLVTSGGGGLATWDLIDAVAQPLPLGDVGGAGPVGAGDTVAFGGFTDTAVDGGFSDEGVPLPPPLEVDLYTIVVGAPAPTRLTGGPGTDAPAGITDDGTVFFLSEQSGSTQLWSIGLAGGEPTQVTTTATIFGRPAVSSDGALLCWEDAAAGVLVVADVVGGVAGEPRRLGDGFDGSDPAFASDGRVVFRRFIEADVDTAVAELFVFDPADGTVTQLTSDGAVASAPALAR